MWFEGGEELARPADVGVVVGRVLPHRHDVEEEGRLAVAEGGLVVADAGNGAAPADDLGQAER